MPFTDPISSVSGRESRASNVSAITVSTRSQARPSQPFDTLATAGVFSMLKTTTDTGDIGSLSFNHSHLPAITRLTHQRKPQSVLRSSDLTLQRPYAPSQTSKASLRDWDTMSNPRRASLTSMQSLPVSLAPGHSTKAQSLAPPISDELTKDGRSYSLTSTRTNLQLPHHRSQTSLTSHTHGLRHNAQARPSLSNLPPVSVKTENKLMYVYPTRLKRPERRDFPSVSSAVGATLDHGPLTNSEQPLISTRQMHARSGPHAPPYWGNNAFEPGHHSSTHPMHIRPPPRMALNPSIQTSGYSDTPQYPYRLPMASRSAPGIASAPSHLRTYQTQQYMITTTPDYSRYANMASQGPKQYSVPYPNSAHQPLRHTIRDGSRISSSAPMAHHIFHNAARNVRHLPSRVGTPMTDGSPPSSDPPSSGTMPSRSSPPTPINHAALEVTPELGVVDPSKGELPDSFSEPLLPQQYLEYAEALEKELDDQGTGVVHTSVPPAGFVQRVRAMLESKAIIPTVTVKTADEWNSQDFDAICYDDVESHVHELAANETPRLTVIEEVDAPAELPASPVKIAELADSSVPLQRRITREMVKAELGPSDSIEERTLCIESGESTGIDVVIDHIRNHSRDQHVDEAAQVQAGAESAVEPLLSTPKNCRQTAKQSTEDGSTSPKEASSFFVLDSGAQSAQSIGIDTASEQTHSKDPFVLDADTITLQHQKQKENEYQRSTRMNIQEAVQDSISAGSPLRSGDFANRDSAVSPLNTQLVGIDETLHPVSEHGELAASITSDHTRGMTTSDYTIPRAYIETISSPPTSRMQRGHSKSVQLHPMTDISETSSSNRLSLPQDLSTIGDTISESTVTEAITDVAVRFSLPRKTAKINKASIVEVPPSSSTETSPQVLRSQPVRQDFVPKSKPSSVRFNDEVFPLNIAKKHNAQLDGKSVGETHARGKDSVMFPQPENDSLASFGDNTTDFGAIGFENIADRLESTPLHGLKEESMDSFSLFDKSGLETQQNRDFPLLARIAAMKALQERRMQESAMRAKARRAHRHRYHPLAEVRDLPSLNFSSMDLIDKLNEALEIRSSKSMDIVRRNDFSGIYSPAPQRPMSTEPLRDRYMSFFRKPEEFSSGFEDETSTVKDEATSPDLQGEIFDRASSPQVPAVEVQPETEVNVNEDTSRPLSPEDFLSVATQINRLSIPSVSGLSDRLSGLLPNLRELQLDSILAEFSDGKVHCRPETALSNRTSAGFRTLAERAEEIVKNGTHDSVAQSDLPALLQSISAGKMPNADSSEVKVPYLSGSVSAPTELGKQSSWPTALLLQSRSPPTSAAEVFEMLPPEMNPITRNPKRALITSSGSRPWNQDENYPWSATRLDMDLSSLSPTQMRKSVIRDALALRKVKSLDFTSMTKSTFNSFKTRSDCADRQQPSPMPEIERFNDVYTKQKRKMSKKSVIGSITKRIGFQGSASPDRTKHKSFSSPDTTMRSDCTSPQPHRPGERYPTSGLAPPAMLNLDEIRSFFSDDSSEEKQRHGSLRKRLTHLKVKGRSARFEPPRSQSRSQSLDVSTVYDGGLATIDRIGAQSAADAKDYVGMSKTEFRIKRIGAKIRLLVAKGSQLLRSWSQRSRTPTARADRLREDWLSDSLYSGV